MKKLLLTLLILSIPLVVYGSPSTTLTIDPAATDGAVIDASDENDRNSDISTWANAHDHTDISQTGNTLSIGDGAAGNKIIQANNADGTKPYFKYDDTNNYWIIFDGANTGGAVKHHGTGRNYTTIPASMANGSIMYANGSDLVELGAGTSGQFLKTQGVGSAPTWDDTGGGYFVGTFTQDLSVTGTNSVTGVGFQPAAVIMFGNIDNSITVSWGFAASTTEWCIYKHSTTDYFGQYNSRVVAAVTGASDNVHATLTSMDADGFTTTWAKNGTPTGTIMVGFLAFR